MTPTLNPDPMVWSQTRNIFVFSKHVKNFSCKIAKRVRLISRVLSRYITTTPLTSLSALQATFLSLTLNVNLFPCLFLPLSGGLIRANVDQVCVAPGRNNTEFEWDEQILIPTFRTTFPRFFFHKYFSCIKQHKIDVTLRIHISDCYYISHLICW